MENGALDVYMQAYDRWSTQLLGIPPWKNSAAASLQCGWSLTGDRRAVMDVAMRRARLWLLPSSDFYRALFLQGQASDPRLSWAGRSLDLLRRYGVPDLPDLGVPLVPLSVYKARVLEVLAHASWQYWWAKAGEHALPLPFHDLWGSCALTPASVLQSSCSWDGLSGHRSMCQLRMGALNIGHKCGKRSQAAVRSCIYCNKLVRSPYLHALGECKISHAAGIPNDWGAEGLRSRTMSLLCCHPDSLVFGIVAGIAKRMEQERRQFWKA